LENCSKIFDGKEVRKLTEKDRKEILDNIDDLAKRARRNLAIAYRKLEEYDRNKMKMEDVETDMIFM